MKGKYFIKYILSALSSAIVELIVFNLVLLAAKNIVSLKNAILISTIVGRVISSLYNYTVNKKGVFASDEPVVKTMIKYYLLVIAQILCSSRILYWISTLLGVSNNQGMISILKLCVDSILFFATFTIQKKWIFKK